MKLPPGRHRLLVLLVAAITPLGHGCGQETTANIPSPPPPVVPDVKGPSLDPSVTNQADYFPLSVPRRWEYDVRYKLPFLSPRTAGVISEMDEVVEINGKTYHRLSIKVTNVPINQDSVSYYRKGEQGLVELKGTGDEASEQLVMPLPLAVGQNWTVNTEDGDVHGEVLAQETVTCGDVDFNDCFKIQFKRGSEKQVRWFAADVGMVRRTQETTTYQAEVTLKQFHAGQ